ncbi:MAG: tripartite tricarboxylate transporter TctB family protein [Elioraea sp.]|nr:tripartite tricarboxylate transporter TctB family protein [Elioraea sp.]MDW8445194.1 tripartite tricarboxylate transporter TctB family protein [Acetobacteraceae bacterium]
MRARPRRDEVAFALLLVALALLSLWQTLVIPVSPIYARVGPTAFPWIASVGLLVFSLVLLVQALRGGLPGLERPRAPDWRSLGWVGAGLAANAVLITTLGFVFAAVALFACTARGFGSTRPLRDALIGAVVGLAAFLGFARLLGVNIGAGVLEGLL